jgi:hypothetical protein
MKSTSVGTRGRKEGSVDILGDRAQRFAQAAEKCVSLRALPGSPRHVAWRSARRPQHARECSSASTAVAMAEER